MIQPFFDYACIAWYPNVSKKLKMCLPAAQNKCIKFGLKLNDICSIKSKDLKKWICLWFMKGYYNVLYAACTNFLQKILLIILMRYMFL